MKRSILIVAGALFIAAAAFQAVGQGNQRDMVKEKAIVDRLQKIAPKAVHDFESGTAAMDNGDYAGGARFYRSVLSVARGFSPAQRRLGFCLIETGQRQDGLQFLEQAVSSESSPENLSSLANALAFPGEHIQPSKSDQRRALSLMSTAHRLDPSDVSYLVLEAEIALDLDSETEFKQATAELVRNHPELMETHYFNAIRAASDEEWSTAKTEIETAGRDGIACRGCQQVSGFGCSLESSGLALRALRTVCSGSLGAGASSAFRNREGNVQPDSAFDRARRPKQR